MNGTGKDETRPKKLLSKKIMMIVFYDFRGVVCYEFLPTDQTVNNNYYLSVLHRLRDAVRRKRTEIWREILWFLQLQQCDLTVQLLFMSF